jgi:hypothetical protein
VGRRVADGWRLSIQGLSVVMANTGVDVSWGRVTKAFEIIPVKGKPVKVRTAAGAGCSKGLPGFDLKCVSKHTTCMLRHLQRLLGDLWAHVASSCAHTKMQVSDECVVSAAGLQHHAQRDAAGGHGAGAGVVARAAPHDRDGAGERPRSAKGPPTLPLNNGCRAIPPSSPRVHT